MIVYVLTQGWEYEGENVLAVYSTLASANQRQTMEEKDSSAHYHVIYEVTIDSPDEPKEMK